MPKGYRFALAALGLALTCQASAQEAGPPNQAEPESPNPDNAQSGTSTEDQAQPADAIASALNGIESRIAELERSMSQGESKAENDRAERDLNAQEDMAFWAKLMFWANFATVALTFVALVAIIRTLHHTRRAADAADEMNTEARAATKAALDTLSVTQTLGERELIAYIAAEECFVSYIERAQRYSKAVLDQPIPHSLLAVRGLGVRFVNSGQTPPRWFDFNFDFILQNRGNNENITLESDDFELTYNWLMPGKNDIVVMFNNGFYEKARKILLKDDRGIALICKGSVYYEDIFFKSNVSDFFFDASFFNATDHKPKALLPRRNRRGRMFAEVKPEEGHGEK